MRANTQTRMRILLCMLKVSHLLTPERFYINSFNLRADMQQNKTIAQICKHIQTYVCIYTYTYVYTYLDVWAKLHRQTFALLRELTRHDVVEARSVWVTGSCKQRVR